MFTGIVEAVGSISEIDRGRLTITAPLIVGDLEDGSSISVDGVCLTVTSSSECSFSVDVVPETFRRTKLNSLQIGEAVNLERALLVGKRIDGHIVQGHVDAIGTIKSISGASQDMLVTIQAPTLVMRYVVEKGFIAVDGTSLTVVNCTSRVFTIALIPYTRGNTTLGSCQVDGLVNIEVDILGKYIEKLALGGSRDSHCKVGVI